MMHLTGRNLIVWNLAIRLEDVVEIVKGIHTLYYFSMAFQYINAVIKIFIHKSENIPNSMSLSTNLQEQTCLGWFTQGIINGRKLVQDFIVT